MNAHTRAPTPVPTLAECLENLSLPPPPRPLGACLLCLTAAAGNGPALQDGSFEGAGFNRPQGLAYSARRNAL